MSTVCGIGSGVINLHVLLKVGDLPLIFLYWQSGGGAHWPSG